MSRVIDLVVVQDGQIVRLTGMARHLLGYRVAKSGDGLVVNGGGMDMVFAVVYDLGRALWPEGTPEAHGVRNGELDRDGGYALKSASL